MCKYYKEPISILAAGKDEKNARRLEEVARLLGEILAEMKQNNAELKEHNRIVSRLDERVRKISINTGDM